MAASRTKIPTEVRDAITANAVEYIEDSYRLASAAGRKEPCLSVGEIADYLRQARMPEDFRFSTRARQRSWVRSILESLRRRGKLGSSIGAPGRCYEPGRSD